MMLQLDHLASAHHEQRPQLEHLLAVVTHFRQKQFSQIGGR